MIRVPIIAALTICLAVWIAGCVYLFMDAFGMPLDVALVFVFGWIVVGVGCVHLDARREFRAKGRRPHA